MTPSNLSLLPPPLSALGTQLMTLPGCRTGVCFSCFLLWAHTVPSTFLADKKAWHPDHLCKEATHFAPVTLA